MQLAVISEELPQVLAAYNDRESPERIKAQLY